MIDFLVVSFVCVFVCPSLPSVRFGQILRYADKRIVNINEVDIKRNNLKVELIRLHKNLDFIHVSFAKRRIQCNIAHRAQI